MNIRKKLASDADEICALSAVAKRYVRGGAWTMAAAMFHTIDRMAKLARDEAEYGTDETIRINPRRRTAKNKIIKSRRIVRRRKRVKWNRKRKNI